MATVEASQGGRQGRQGKPREAKGKPGKEGRLQSAACSAQRASSKTQHKGLNTKKSNRKKGQGVRIGACTFLIQMVLQSAISMRSYRQQLLALRRPWSLCRRPRHRHPPRCGCRCGCRCTRRRRRGRCQRRCRATAAAGAAAGGGGGAAAAQHGRGPARCAAPARSRAQPGWAAQRGQYQRWWWGLAACTAVSPPPGTPARERVGGCGRGEGGSAARVHAHQAAAG